MNLENFNSSVEDSFFPSEKFNYVRKYGVSMEKTEKKEQLEMMREVGVKCVIVPVQNLFNEGQRIEEFKRLGKLDLNLSIESRYNSMTQVATYLTDCPQSQINILGSDVQQCKASFGFAPEQIEMMEEMPR